MVKQHQDDWTLKSVRLFVNTNQIHQVQVETLLSIMEEFKWGVASLRSSEQTFFLKFFCLLHIAGKNKQVL